MNPIPQRHRMVISLTLFAVLVCVCLTVLFVFQKHQAAEQYLADIEPRYARMRGLQQQSAALDAAIQKAKVQRSEYVHPSTDDASQTGNAAQQRLRDIFGSAGLQIISSQVLPAKHEKDIDRIPLSVSVEGDLLALQAALAGLSGQNPAILLDAINVQAQNFGNTSSVDRKPTRLSIQLSLSVLRERS